MPIRVMKLLVNPRLQRFQLETFQVPLSSMPGWCHASAARVGRFGGAQGQRIARAGIGNEGQARLVQILAEPFIVRENEGFVFPNRAAQ